MLRVLGTQQENVTARNELRRRGLDCLRVGLVQKLLRRSGLLDTIQVGDHAKSWDVFCAARFIEENLSRQDAILDLGAYASEILCILYRLGYSNLTGIDFNPDIRRMPHRRKIRYLIGDFMRTPFRDATFNAITAMSVIEHGFQAENLLREISRLLMPGGHFIASMDYWPTKIDTDGIRAFDLDWVIFSEEEVKRFVESAQSYGLVAAGAMDYRAQDAVVDWNRRRYTFAWLVMQKRLGP